MRYGQAADSDAQGLIDRAGRHAAQCCFGIVNVEIEIDQALGCRVGNVARAGSRQQYALHFAGDFADGGKVRTGNAHSDRRFDWRAVGEAAKIDARAWILIELGADFLDLRHTFGAMPLVKARIDLAEIRNLLGRDLVVINLRIATAAVREAPLDLGMP